MIIGREYRLASGVAISYTTLMQIFVIRSTEMDRTKAFFEQLGLPMVEEKHGNGPTHWSCEQNGVVFEIYPAKKNDSMKFLDDPQPIG